jgi:hypothetical protein
VSRALLLVVALSGCFSPTFGDGNTPCGSNKDCPSGLHCAADGTCWHNGKDPVLDLSVAMPDLSVNNEMDGGFDLSVPSDLGESVDLQEPDLTPVIKHQGEACTPSDQCVNSICVDGYCCNSTCTTLCQACNVSGFLGICSNVGIGLAPVGTRTCNAQAASSCGRDGMCDGLGNCRNWSSGTVCGAGTCELASGNFTNPSTCDGAGTCNSNGGGNCAPYKCQDATQCFSICTGSDSSPCSGTNTCTNGSCGKLPDGRTCTNSDGSQCLNGNCVDGKCCNSACASPCQACDVSGSPGICTTVPGPRSMPHGTRTCTNQTMTPCGGYCNGSVATCTYADNTQNCGTTCSSMTQLQNSFCDMAGHCVPAVPQTCNGNFACLGSACLMSCNNDGECGTSAFGCTAANACVQFCACDDTKLDECIVK